MRFIVSTRVKSLETMEIEDYMFFAVKIFFPGMARFSER